ncbi:MAG: hypothetical protein LC777_10940, partial [Actinobacteria bacterium]|nr:hypothetical protein [Actinomycetota bacterium]
ADSPVRLKRDPHQPRPQQEHARVQAHRELDPNDRPRSSSAQVEADAPTFTTKQRGDPFYHAVYAIATALAFAALQHNAS